MKSFSILMITGCLFSIGTDVYASALPGDLSYTGDQGQGTVQQQDLNRDISEARAAPSLPGAVGPLQPAEVRSITKSMLDQGVPTSEYHIIDVKIEGESELKQMAQEQELGRVLKDDDVDALKVLMRNPSWDELSNLRFIVSVNHYNEITLYQNGTGTVEQGDCPERIRKLFRYSFINPLELSMVFGAIGCFKHLVINNINTGKVDHGTMGFTLAIGKDTEMIQIALEQGLVSLKDLLFGWAISVPNLILFNNGLTTIEGLSGAMSYVMARNENFSSWIIDTVIGEVGIDATDCDGWTPLMHAAESGNSEAVRLLIERRADVNARNQRGTTPLMVATERGYTDIAELLLEKGANVNVRIVELFIEKGADVNLIFVRTPLMVATERGYMDIAELLLEKGANVNVRDVWRNTPLMYAASRGNSGIIKLLIERRADVNARNKRGRTSLTFALEHNHPDIVRLLKAQLALDNRLMVATRGGDLDGVIESIERGANVHATDDRRNTALMLAIEHNQPEIARLLIERGADATPEQIKTLEANKAPPPAE